MVKARLGPSWFGMFVVAAGDYAVSCVAEGDGEDSGGVGAVEDGGVEDLPGLSAVGGVEDAGGAASGGEPDVRGSADCAAGWRGRSCWRRMRLRLRLRRGVARAGLASRSGRRGDEEFEFQFARYLGIVWDGIAEDYAVGSVPEDHGVEEAFGICVGELELPVLAGVGGVVDAGLVAGAGGHEESFVGGESYYGAEIESCGVGDLGGDPGAAGVGGAEIGSVGAGGPRDFARDGAYSAQAFRGVGELFARADCARAVSGKKRIRSERACGIVCAGAEMVSPRETVREL